MHIHIIKVILQLIMDALPQLIFSDLAAPKVWEELPSPWPTFSGERKRSSCVHSD